MHRSAAMGLTAAVVGAVVGTGGVASAAPVNAKNAQRITLSCSNGQTYAVVVNSGGGNQDKTTFTPGFILGTNQHIKPVSFGTFTFSINGQVMGSQPGSSRGQGKIPPHATPLTCTFSQSMTDPVTGDLLTFSGSVVGYIPGNRH